MKSLYTACVTTIRQRSLGAIVMVMFIMGVHYFRTGRLGWPDLAAAAICYAIVILIFTGITYSRRNDARTKASE